MARVSPVSQEVSRRLGHADITITLKVYAHLMPNDDEKLAAGPKLSLVEIGRTLGVQGAKWYPTPENEKRRKPFGLRRFR